MLYITVEETSLLIPQVSIPTSPVDKRLPYIHLASRLVDAAIGRSRFGLGVVDVINEPIALDLNYNGIFPHDPFVSWNADTMQITMKNAGRRPDVRVSDFEVDNNKGILRYIGDTSGAWPMTRGGVSGPWNQTISPYHTGTLYQVENNETPFTMFANFKAGKFVITGIASSASAGSNQVTVLDTTGIIAGNEFYFSTDPVSDMDIDKRIIIDVTNNVVTFSPSLSYVLPSSAKFRQIDHAVRVACGMVISDLITFPSNTIKYSKSLGKGEIAKSWTRSVSNNLPVAAYELLSPYIRF